MTICRMVAGLFVLAGLVHSQGQAPDPPTFTVATIRPTEMSLLDKVLKGIPDVALSGARVELNSVSLLDLMAWAYEVPNYRVKVPSRLLDHRYQIAAVASRELSRKELAEPLKTLLAERFHVEMHVEKQKIAVDLLIVGPQGLKMRPASEKKPLKATVRSDGMRQLDYVTTLETFTAVPVTPGRPILDRTGIEGIYAGTMAVSIAEMESYMRPLAGTPSGGAPPDGLRSPMADAIEQLGLRYVPASELMDVYVLDTAEEKPSVD